MQAIIYQYHGLIGNTSNLFYMTRDVFLTESNVCQVSTIFNMIRFDTNTLGQLLPLQNIIIFKSQEKTNFIFFLSRPHFFRNKN